MIDTEFERLLADAPVPPSKHIADTWARFEEDAALFDPRVAKDWIDRMREESVREMDEAMVRDVQASGLLPTVEMEIHTVEVITPSRKLDIPWTLPEDPPMAGAVVLPPLPGAPPDMPPRRRYWKKVTER